MKQLSQFVINFVLVFFVFRLVHIVSGVDTWAVIGLLCVFGANNYIVGFLTGKSLRPPRAD